VYRKGVEGKRIVTTSLAWALAGMALAVLLSVSAHLRSRTDSPNYFAQEVYGMDCGAHRRWAIVGFAFTLVFAVAALVPAVPSIPVFAAFTVTAILYAASFARGATEEEET